MKTIILNDILTSLKQRITFAAFIVFIGLGFLTGFKFNISVGDELAVNSAYSIGFMIGLLSLTIILIATVFAFVLLFKEEDANFGLIIFSTPINKKEFAIARFLSYFIITLLGFFLLVIGYAVGLNLQSEAQMNPGFNLWHYLFPFIIFGVLNTLMVSSIIFFISQKSKNKLLAALTGILLYVFYMIGLMFSNAPFMAQSLPQSIFVQQISAAADIFGLSGYFFEAKDLTLLQRNNQVVPLSNYFLFNRLMIILFSLTAVYLGIRSFSFLPIYKGKSKVQNSTLKAEYLHTPFSTASSLFNLKTKLVAVFSFIKIDSIYLFKSTAFTAVTLLLLFYLGVEMFDDIDKGIRLPQHYASSGLLAQTINSTFYFLGALLLVYFVNDIFWRSNASRFSIIESTTYFSKEKVFGHAGSILVLILYLTFILILEAVIFQIIFNYPYFDWNAYYGVLVFNTFPLILLSLFLLLLNIVSKNKSAALGLSILFFLIFTTPISKSIIDNSLFRFLSGYRGNYSDFLGYGIYLNSFLFRLAFGFSIAGLLFLVYYSFKNKNNRITKSIAISILVVTGFLSGSIYSEGYIPQDDESIIKEKVFYEKELRKYQNIPQPAINEVTAEIDLFPNEQSYRIRGNYIIQNRNDKSIDSILLNLPNDFKIISLIYRYKDEVISIDKPVSELILSKAITPNSFAELEFEMSYKWHPVNGHNSYNAIVENGSFMRVSRYFPRFGYDEEMEIQDNNQRKKYGLGSATEIKPLEAPKVKSDDFINLAMTISTHKNQTAVGTGELKKEWQQNGRNYFEYRAESIPFRFALSSAEYRIKSVEHNGIKIQVLYHPLHRNNVDHLIENTKLTLDYCINNFGPYPFQSVVFAEVSSFTEGFAGTAYPGVIFMTENMTFNANIKVEKNQDVVNELAGHETAHFWWGTNQIDPDYREGYAMLTESLAMYTEMMIYKKMYGKSKMLERLDIHRQIYDAEKGFNENVSLSKATKDHPYLAYSKGAVVFVELSELIGEEQLNLALKNFLTKHKHPNAKPISTDLLKEIIEHSDEKYHTEIKLLFE